MYQYKKEVVGAFTIHKATPSVSDDHKKLFDAGVTPQNQKTLNVYVQGAFRFVIGDFEQTLRAGDTSLDLDIEAFPVNTLCIETCLTQPAVRYCVSKTEPGPWNREKVISDTWLADSEGLFIDQSGNLELLSAGQGTQGRLGVFCWAD